MTPSIKLKRRKLNTLLDCTHRWQNHSDKQGMVITEVRIRKGGGCNPRGAHRLLKSWQCFISQIWVVVI